MIKRERAHILVVDDEDLIRWSLREAFEKVGYEVFEAGSGKQALQLLKQESMELVILDVVLPDENGIDVLKKIREGDKEIQVIIMTAFGSIENAVQAMKLGALDYFQKPFNLDEVVLKVEKALNDASRIRELRRFKRKQAEELNAEKIIYVSKIMHDILGKVKKICMANVDTILLTGETGVGKGLLAKTIHNLAANADGPFVTLNCSAIPDSLIESELFGYERGAFTDARSRKEGLVEEAVGGTLFLDEIGEMPIKLQGKLLRFIEERKIRRVGSAKEIGVDVRVVAATNRDLQSSMQAGEFRPDLYHRLNLIHITIPPLRERKEDIVPLAEYFLGKFKTKYRKNIKCITKDALDQLKNYSWPGNIRELSNVLERCCILENVEEIGKAEILSYLIKAPISLQTPKSSEINLLDNDISFDGLVNNFKRQVLRRALEECNYNKTKAAQLLKMDRSTFKYQLRMVQLED